MYTDDDEDIDLAPVHFEHKTPLPDFGGMRIDELSKQFIDLRDELSAITKVYKEEKARIKDIMQRISMAMRDLGDQLGVDSFNTPYGTAYRLVSEKYRVSNWEEALKYIIKNEAWFMLERRVSKKAASEVHKGTGDVPPGLDYSLEVGFTVRRASKRKEN